MVTYRIDWSNINHIHGWGCSNSKDYHAAIGFLSDEHAKLLEAQRNKKYKYTHKTLDLKVYAFMVAEHIELINKKKPITLNDQIIICRDRDGHHDDIVDFALDFLKKKGIVHIHSFQLQPGETKKHLAHDLALAFTRKDYCNIPEEKIIKHYKFETFDAAISRKKKNF